MSPGREPKLELTWTLCPRSNKENVAESTIIKHVDYPWLSRKLVCPVLCSCISKGFLISRVCIIQAQGLEQAKEVKCCSNRRRKIELSEDDEGFFRFN
jgi:hypothetical protein